MKPQFNGLNKIKDKLNSNEDEITEEFRYFSEF